MTGLEWGARAACKGAPDLDCFFPVGGIRATREDCAEALAYCGRCEVSDACLDYALTASIQHGVWGGTTEFERDVMAKQARRAEREAAGVAGL